MGCYRANPYLGGITFTPNKAGYMATLGSRHGVMDHMRVMLGHRVMGLHGVMGHSYRVIQKNGVT